MGVPNHFFLQQHQSQTHRTLSTVLSIRYTTSVSSTIMMSIALSMMVFTAALLPHASANTRMPGRMFWEDPREVVRAAAPMWHFGRPGGSVSFLPILQKVLALLTPYLEIMLPVRGSPRQWQKTQRRRLGQWCSRCIENRLC